MRIGIIGAGNIGGTLGGLLEAAGHDIRFGVRNPDAARPRSGPVAEAAAFGEVVIFAGPFGAWPSFAGDHAAHLAGKVVIDASNPVAERDGSVALDVIASGRGAAAFVASLLPESEVVKAFNTIYWVVLRDEAGREGEKLAMPIAADLERGRSSAVRLARDAGFDPVIVGGLDRSIQLDPGSAIYAKSLTADGVRDTLGLTAGEDA
jgi:hypothetical protein